MTASDIDSIIFGPLAEFAAAGAEQADDAFRRLVASLWDQGSPVPGALAAVPALVGSLGELPHERRARLVLLLGMFAGTPEAHGAIQAGVQKYLELLAGARRDRPLVLALLYLLAHFPQERGRIMAAVAGLDLEADDLTRLDRCLSRFEPGEKLLLRKLGRGFPSPAAWGLTDGQLLNHVGWADREERAKEQLTAMWALETHSLRNYSGAKAAWAVLNDTPDAGGTSWVNPLARHADVLRCTRCHHGVAVAGDHLSCAGCAAEYPVTGGYLDFLGSDELEPYHDPLFPPAYEQGVRAGFLRLMGSNWADELTPADEDRYLAEHVRPVGGPVLDLAAGAGRWTRVLAHTVGADRVIGLDVSRVMLARLRRALPDVLALRGIAMELPFRDATLGAVNCWNALQALPEPESVLAEVARCLRPGGTFTLLTYRAAADPVYGHFQSWMDSRARRPTFEPARLRELLSANGMSVEDQACPGTFVIMTAVRG
jgi:SAM-dependent methyltransferase